MCRDSQQSLKGQIAVLRFMLPANRRVGHRAIAAYDDSVAHGPTAPVNPGPQRESLLLGRRFIP